MVSMGQYCVGLMNTRCQVVDSKSSTSRMTALSMRIARVRA